MKYISTPLDQFIALEHEARQFGFDWPHQESILAQAISECTEIREAIQQKESPERIQEEIGDLLHTAISLCIFSGFDVHHTLEILIEKFGNRMASLKEITHQRGLPNLKGQSTEFMLELWDEVKKHEKSTA